MNSIVGTSGKIDAMLLSLKYRTTAINFGRVISPANTSNRKLIGVAFKDEIRQYGAGFAEAAEQTKESLIEAYRDEGVELFDIRLVSAFDEPTYSPDLFFADHGYCGIYLDSDSERWPQDEIQFVEYNSAGNIIHMYRNDLGPLIVGCDESDAFSIAKHPIRIAGGDTLILEEYALIGGSEYEKAKSIGDFNSFAGKEVIPISSAYTWRYSSDFASGYQSAMTKKMNDGFIRQPLYHLDLYLNALESKKRIVFYLGYIHFSENYKVPASKYIDIEYHEIQKSLNGMVDVLHGLEHRIGKEVVVRRVPILVGPANVDETYSYANGFIESSNGVGNFYVAYPKSRFLGISNRELKEIHKIVLREYGKDGVNTIFIESSDSAGNIRKGGLHCRGKVLNRI